MGRALARSHLSTQGDATRSPLFLLVVLVSILLATGFPAQVRAQDKPINLRLAIVTPASHFQATRQLSPWIADIAKATQGRVKIDLYPAGTLLEATEIYDGVVRGAADLGVTIFGYAPGRFPFFEAFELPGIPYNNATVAGHVVWDAYKQLKPAEVGNVKLLFLYANGPAALLTKTPIRKLEDLRGMPIRSTGHGTKALAALGATPVPMPIAEVYGALQKGIVQGVLMPLDGLRAWRFAELTKYTTIAPYMTTTLFAVVMNANRWQSLPTEIKKAFEEVSESWLAKSGAVADDENLQALEWATKRHDHEVIVLPPNEVARWMARLQPEQDKYVSTMTAKGLPGKTTLDLALRLAERYNKQFPASQLPAR